MQEIEFYCKKCRKTMKMSYLWWQSFLIQQTPSYLVWGSTEEEGWLSELNIIAGSIKNPAIREAALKQMLALAQMDAQLK